MTRWLSTAEAARRLGINQQAIGYLIRTGALPAVKACSRYRITEQAIAAYLAAKALAS